MDAAELRIGNYLDYKVREDGVIFSKRNGKPLKYRLNDKGYPTVMLQRNKKAICRRVHRIVAEVFCFNPSNKPCVNHKDRNRQNYHASNLQWMTHSENVKHSIKNGGRKNWTRNNAGTRNSNNKYSWNMICAIRILYSEHSYSQNQLADIFNITQGKVSKIVNNKIWKSVS